MIYFISNSPHWFSLLFPRQCSCLLHCFKSTLCVLITFSRFLFLEFFGKFCELSAQGIFNFTPQGKSSPDSNRLAARNVIAQSKIILTLYEVVRPQLTLSDKTQHLYIPIWWRLKTKNWIVVSVEHTGNLSYWTKNKRLVSVLQINTPKSFFSSNLYLSGNSIVFRIWLIPKPDN